MLPSALVKELKTSTSAWDAFGGRAAKLASQLHQVAAAFGSFVDALQTISDSANTVNGVSRDIGAALTRFCLRQRAVETALRKWGETLQKHCADGLGRRGGEWRQTISDLERRHQRNCKRFKTSGGGKPNKSNRQQIDAENRNFYIELLHAQRTQCTEFVVGSLLPVINAQMVLLNEGAHIQPILDSVEKSVNENDTAHLIQTFLEDIDNGRESGEQRIGVAMAQSRAKSASQARLYGVGSEQTDDDDHSSAAPSSSLHYNGSASLLLMANRNSMPPPPPAVNSHFLFSSCPASAAATISSSSSSSPFAVVGPSPPSKGNNCEGIAGGNATTPMANDGTAAEDIWQQNVPHRTVPSFHQRLPLPQPFVHHQTAATDQNATVSPPPPTSLYDDTSPQILSQCQKPPLPPSMINWSRTNCVSHQQNARSTTGPQCQPNSLAATENAAPNFAGEDALLSSVSFSLRAAVVNKMPTDNDFICASSLQNGTQIAPPSPLPPPPADSTDSVSHCSSALMAETLQQIDQLGLELNSYCDGLDELGNGNGGGKHRFVAVPPHSLRPFVADSLSANAAVRFRTSVALPQFQSCASGAPPPPQRRNSSISAATPSAPSIAQLRSIGASSGTPFGPSALPLTSHPKNAMGPVAVPPSPSPMPSLHPPPMRR